MLSLSIDSEEERIAVETACKYGSKAGIYDVSTVNDVTIYITMDGEEPQLGADTKLAIVVKNTSSEVRTFNLHGQVVVMYYTGVYKATVKKDQIPVELQPNEGVWLLFRSGNNAAFNSYRINDANYRWLFSS